MTKIEKNKQQSSNKIMRLEINNYKKISVVEITPEGNLVKINGANGAGKSSVLDAITAALGGKNTKATPKPIKEGQKKAQIVLETEDLIVTRRFTENNTNLVVTNKDGDKISKGQQTLDDLLGKLSLDPLAFTQLEDKEQLETLINLVDLPFDPKELAQQRQNLFDARLAVGRRERAIGDLDVDKTLPEQETSATDLISEIRQAQQHNQQIQDVEQTNHQLEADIERLEQQLKETKKLLKDGNKQLQQLGEQQDVTTLETQLSQVEETNANIRSNNLAKEQMEQKNQLQQQYEQYTSDIEDLDKQKSEGLAQADMPVEGLGFDDHGVTFEGIPFRQVNTASQIKVSFAMAISMNPQLRVVRIAEGSLLDEDNLQLIAELADEHDYQVWIEQVGKGDGTGIVIEDGQVA